MRDKRAVYYSVATLEEFSEMYGSDLWDPWDMDIWLRGLTSEYSMTPVRRRGSIIDPIPF